MKKCQSCDKQLQPNFNLPGTYFVPPDEVDDSFDYLGALEVKFRGGYGMFIDPTSQIESQPLHFLLCSHCAIEMCEKLPWMKRVFYAYFTAEDCFHLEEDVDHAWLPEGEDEYSVWMRDILILGDAEG